MKIWHFINLTNGIELFKNFEFENFSFIRIQSTWCEQKLWNDILFSLSDDFLMKLAIGYYCIVHDYTVHKNGYCRAMWQGMEWIKFVLYKIWFNKTYQPIGRAKTMLNYFEQEFKKLDNKTIKKIQYYKKFLLVDDINLSVEVGVTDLDGKYEIYKDILREIV